MNIKHDIYEQIFKKRKRLGVSSILSTIPLKILSEKLSEDDKKDFIIPIFHPVRYMGLLEIIRDN